MEYAANNKKGKITMSKKLHEEFVNFKTVLSNLPTIGRFQDGYPIIIFTDASRYATGAVVIQLNEKLDKRDMRSAIEDIENNNGKVKVRILGCSSHKLSKPESRYTVYELELLTIDKVLEQYKQWLLGSPMTIVTDHDNLSKLETKVRITPRIARTVEFMLQFNLQICFMEGTSNTLADGLSRYPIHRSAKIEPSEVELFKHKQLFQATLELCGTPNNDEIPN